MFCQFKGDIFYFEISVKEVINIDQVFEGQFVCVYDGIIVLIIVFFIVIVWNVFVQEELEEFSGDFDDLINICIENDCDGCVC